MRLYSSIFSFSEGFMFVPSYRGYQFFVVPILYLAVLSSVILVSLPEPGENKLVRGPNRKSIREVIAYQKQCFHHQRRSGPR